MGPGRRRETRDKGWRLKKNEKGRGTMRERGR